MSLAKVWFGVVWLCRQNPGRPMLSLKNLQFNLKKWCFSGKNTVINEEVSLGQLAGLQT